MNVITFNFFKLAGFVIAGLLILLPEISISGTSRMDNEFFAFKPARIFAVRDGGMWKISREHVHLGLQGKFFIFDVSKAQADIPAVCQRKHLVDISKTRPVRAKIPQLGGVIESEGQLLTLRNKSDACELRIWLQAPRSFDKRSFGAAKAPNTPSIIIGLIQFKEGGRSKYVEFAVGADDV